MSLVPKSGQGIKRAANAMEMVGEARVAAKEVAKNGKKLYHYTDAKGAEGIAETGVILKDAKGRVFVTDKKLTPEEVKNQLFIGNSGEKGSHVIEIEVTDGLPIRPGKNENEFIHQGSIRDGRQGTLTVKPNDF